MAHFREPYQVRRLRQAGHTWVEIAGWEGLSPQALSWGPCVVSWRR